MTEIERNKALIEKYPFLLPRSVWTDEPFDDYDYSYTEIDSLPNGWRIAFGEMMMEEIGESLAKTGNLETFRFDQIKEKYGQLRCYNHGGNEEVDNIIEKYSNLSENICIICGKPDVYMTGGGWICPICKECWENDKYHKKPYEEVIDTEHDTGRMADKMRWRTSNPDGSGWVEHELDISETAKKIRKRWEEKCASSK